VQIFLASVDASSCGFKDNPDTGTYVPQPSGTCPPAGGALSGSVVKNGAVTFCCH